MAAPSASQRAKVKRERAKKEAQEAHMTLRAAMDKV
jgi:hypothetical protein